MALDVSDSNSEIEVNQIQAPEMLDASVQVPPYNFPQPPASRWSELAMEQMRMIRLTPEYWSLTGDDVKTVVQFLTTIMEFEQDPDKLAALEW